MYLKEHSPEFGGLSNTYAYIYIKIERQRICERTCTKPRTLYLSKTLDKPLDVHLCSYFHEHGGDSIDTTCAVVRDVTAYIAVVRVFRFPSEYYGCRYHQCPCFSVHRAKISSLFSAIITENCQEGIYRYFQRVCNFLNI